MHAFPSALIFVLCSCSGFVRAIIIIVSSKLACCVQKIVFNYSHLQPLNVKNLSAASEIITKNLEMWYYTEAPFRLNSMWSFTLYILSY